MPSDFQLCIYSTHHYLLEERKYTLGSKKKEKKQTHRRRLIGARRDDGSAVTLRLRSSSNYVWVDLNCEQVGPRRAFIIKALIRRAWSGVCVCVRVLLKVSVCVYVEA